MASSSPPPKLLTPSQIARIADELFQFQHEQLEHVLSGAVHSPPHSDDPAAAKIKVSPDGYLILSRCCFLLLNNMIDIPELMTRSVHKSRILLDVARALFPPSSYSHLAVAGQSGGVPASYLCAILEVFMYELLMHRQIRKHFAETDDDSATTAKLFVTDWSYGYVNSVLELVSGHCLLSIHGELAFSKFMQSLSWSAKVDNEIPEVGLSAALTLLGAPFMLSAPYMLQTHLIMLTSRCIGINIPTCDKKSSVVTINHLLAAFELSAKLYRVYVSGSDFLDNLIGGENQSSYATEVPTEVPFDSCIRQKTLNELNHRISKLVSFFYEQSHGVLSKNKADIITDSRAYITENEHVLDEMTKDRTCLILNHIIWKIVPETTAENTMQENGEQIQQQMYCLAAVMKLMSSSLLQILWHLKRNEFAVGSKSLESQEPHLEYDFLLGIIGCFGKYGASQAIQEALFSVTETHNKIKEMKLILAHFASLLLYSFKRRLDFLWRGCIFMLMVTMNSFLFEDPNLDAFRPLFSNVETSSVSVEFVTNTPKGLVTRRSSVTIASRFQNIRKLYLKDQVKFPTYENQRPDDDGVGMQRGPLSMPSCNGEAYLSCLPEYQKKPSEYADLIDFIDCTPGKDYNAYLSSRKKFRKWRDTKKKDVKKKKKKKLKAEMKILSRCSY